jgi:RTX calcium-binding nonapeptide repeat (4 copies)
VSKPAALASPAHEPTVCLDQADFPGYPVIRGTDGPDGIVGTAASEVIIGEGGNDAMFGLGGPGADEVDDVIDGGPGDDRLDAGPGADRVDGHQGTDACLNAEVVHSCELAAFPASARAQTVRRIVARVLYRRGR